MGEGVEVIDDVPQPSVFSEGAARTIRRGVRVEGKGIGMATGEGRDVARCAARDFNSGDGIEAIGHAHLFHDRRVVEDHIVLGRYQNLRPHGDEGRNLLSDGKRGVIARRGMDMKVGGDDALWGKGPKQGLDSKDVFLARLHSKGLFRNAPFGTPRREDSVVARSQLDLDRIPWHAGEGDGIGFG